MESSLCCSLLIFFMIGIPPLVIGAPSSLQCTDRNLKMNGGSFTLSKMYEEGSVLRYRCAEGYYPYPVKMRRCYKGKWDPEPTVRRLECKKITCPNPNVLENGNVSPYKRLYYVNDATTYTCNSGYNFRGSSTRVCQMNGKWSGSTPICSRDSDHCADPGIPPGTRRTGHIFSIDDKVTYRCENKLTLVGSTVRVCQDNKEWSGQEPECYADFTYDTPKEVAEAFGSSLKTTLTMYEEKEQAGKKIRLDKGGKLDIYIALDASDSINEDDFDKAKEMIKQLIEKISYYEVTPNYEILIFATDVTEVVKITDNKRGKKKKLKDIIEELMKFPFDGKGDKSGTNIAKAYRNILESISFEKAADKNFNDIRHVVIMFTDGITNVGGNPKRYVDEIRETVFGVQGEKREEYLDLYVFGVGEDVEKKEIDSWVTKRHNEKHFFLLPEIKDVQKALDNIIDESTSVSLCGLHKDYDDGTEFSKRHTYPWLMKINVLHSNGKKSDCLGSLVTPSFILTAAHCFKFADDVENIHVTTPGAKEHFKVSDYIPHPKYNARAKEKEGVSEYYEYDVALVQLEKSVTVSAGLRTICIPCTKETSGALKLTTSDVTCKQHKEMLMKNDLVKAFFMSTKEKNNYKKKNVEIKQGHKRDECIKDAQEALKITKKTAESMITENFLCTGGIGEKSVDDYTCKGDSGGATYVEQPGRLIQVGVISWGLVDICKAEDSMEERDSARDFHTNLFSPEVQVFLKKYLGDGERGEPLTFL